MAEFAPNCSNVETKPSSLQAWSEESQLILLLWFFFGPNDIATDLIRLLWIRFRYSEYSNRNNWFLDKGQGRQRWFVLKSTDEATGRHLKSNFWRTALTKLVLFWRWWIDCFGWQLVFIKFDDQLSPLPCRVALCWSHSSSSGTQPHSLLLFTQLFLFKFSSGLLRFPYSSCPVFAQAKC